MDNLIWFIVIGIVAGFLAGRLTKGKGFGLLANLIIGVGGAFLGAWLFGVLGISLGSGIIGSLVTALIGAVSTKPVPDLIDISALVPGVYLVEVHTQNGNSRIQKVII
jgi:uncharacterized membrane protein YeaQ/YmgE (transglycosylase-associated protein family)